MAYLISISVTDLSTILSLVGATGSTAICYILPGVLFYRMKRMVRGDDNEGLGTSEVGALALSVFGGIMMVVCVVAQVLAIYQEKTLGLHS